LDILWAVFARTQIKSLSKYTDGRTTESKVKQESKEKNDIDSDTEHGQSKQRHGLMEKRECEDLKMWPWRRIQKISQTEHKARTEVMERI